MSKVLIVGDVHAQFYMLKETIEFAQKHYDIDKCLVCGDYGIWNDFKVDSIPKKYKMDYGVPVYFCDGNHENHAELDKYERGKIHQLTDWLYYCAFGSVLEIGGENFLFCGGADSIDKQLRKPFVSWWPTETISLEDLDYLPETDISVVISHTAPTRVCELLTESLGVSGYNGRGGKLLDPSCAYLDRVLDKYIPKRWYFGHWHYQFHMKNLLTEFFGLHMLPNRSDLRGNALEALARYDWLPFLTVLDTQELR